MHNYVHIPLSAPILVKDLVSVYHRQLHQHWSDEDRFNFSELFYVSEGEFSQYVDGTLYTIKPGQLLYLAPGAVHRSAKRNTATVSILTFSSDSAALQTLYNRVIMLSPAQSALFEEIITAGLDMLEWFRDFDDFGFAIKEGVDDLTVQVLKNKLELFLIDLCRHIDSPVSYSESLYCKLTQYLKSHIGEKLTLDEIADALSVSVSKLKHICADHCHTSPIEYFISLKLAEAKRLITETDLNISQIAAALGFSSIHYFSKLFKQKTGVSPSRYGKQTERNE